MTYPESIQDLKLKARMYFSVPKWKRKKRLYDILEAIEKLEVYEVIEVDEIEDAAEFKLVKDILTGQKMEKN